MSNYLKSAYSTKVTPQSQPIPGSKQEQNNAGGYSYTLDDWGRLQRFLVLGGEGGTYYVNEAKLSRDNAESVLRCIKENGKRVVDATVDISVAGRAPKNDPALFVLALASSYENLETRKYAFLALPKVARIGTHLFRYISYVDGMRGYGRGLRNAIANWYLSKSPSQLSFQALKYQARDGWSHRDLLRLSHPRVGGVSNISKFLKDNPLPATGWESTRAKYEAQNAILQWITHGNTELSGLNESDPNLRLLWAFEKAKLATTAEEVAILIREYGLTREMIPTQFLKEASVWAALLQRMPMNAMVRNLGNMSKCGLLVPDSGPTEYVVAQLGNADKIKNSRLHPIAILSALNTYSGGKGVRGKGEWEPVPEIIDALDKAFDLSFGNVKPTGKHYMLALDVSGSMGSGEIAGVPGLTPRTASAAMALVMVRTESNCPVFGFASSTGKSSLRYWGNTSGNPLDGIVRLPLLPNCSISGAEDLVTGLPFGGTDCSLPMLYATKHNIPIDVFVIITDSETWAGNIHPTQALKKYRELTGIPARLVVVGMTATGFTIADPDDAGMLDVVGFDTATPELISNFVNDWQDSSKSTEAEE